MAGAETSPKPLQVLFFLLFYPHSGSRQCLSLISCEFPGDQQCLGVLALLIFFQDFQMKLLTNVLFLYLKVDYCEILVFKSPASRSLEVLLQLLLDNRRTYTVVLVFKSRVFSA